MVSHFTPYTLNYIVKSCLRVALGLSDKAAGLIGYDLGGAVAVGFAARYPHFCKSLTLISPVGILYRNCLNEKKLLPKYTGEFEMAKYRKTLANAENQESH